MQRNSRKFSPAKDSRYTVLTRNTLFCNTVLCFLCSGKLLLVSQVNVLQRVLSSVSLGTRPFCLTACVKERGVVYETGRLHYQTDYTRPRKCVMVSEAMSIH